MYYGGLLQGFGVPRGVVCAMFLVFGVLGGFFLNKLYRGGGGKFLGGLLALTLASLSSTLLKINELVVLSLGKWKAIWMVEFYGWDVLSFGKSIGVLSVANGVVIDT